MMQLPEQRLVAAETINHLLSIEAIQFRFEPPTFKWSSGWNSPIYCDIRQTLSYPAIRTYLKEKLVENIKNNFAEVNAIAGVATAGIPQGALIADKMELPFVYVRAKAKEHGRENLIEGSLPQGAKVVVIEDVISTGKSVLQACQALQQEGYEIIGVAAVFNYGFDKAIKAFEQAEIPFITLANYHTLLVEVQKKYDLREETMASLHEWRKNPEEWQV